MNRSRWQWLLLVVVLSYVGVGFFPWTAVEGDDIAIAAGATQLSLHGDLAHGFDYRYDPQAATYWLVAGLNRLLGIPALTGFGLVTLAGFAAFFGFSTWLVASQTKVPFPLAGLALLLFQEIYVSAYYANSSMVAAGFLMASVFLASRRPAARSGRDLGISGSRDFAGRLADPRSRTRKSRNPQIPKSLPRIAAAGVLFALAGAARFDAVLMAPALLVLLWGRKRASRVRLVRLGIVAVAAFCLLALLGSVSLRRIWQEGSGHVERFTSFKNTLVNYATLTSGAGCLLALLGLRAALEERKWQLIGTSLAGCIPLIAVYGTAVTTPRYLLYALPFFTLLVAYGLKWVLTTPSRPAGWLRWTCLSLVALQYVVGPLTLAGWVYGRNLTVVGTHDGLRRLDAIGYLPVMWLRTKCRYWRALGEARRVLLEACGAERRGLVLTDDWFSSKWTAYQLLRAGYRCVHSVRHFDRIPIVTERDFHVYVQDARKMTTFQVQWLDGPPASRDWRSHLDLASYDTVLFFSGSRDSSEELTGLGELLGCPIVVEPWPGTSAADRLWVYRIRPGNRGQGRGDREQGTEIGEKRGSVRFSMSPRRAARGVLHEIGPVPFLFPST
jgi:hypothetical protein